VSGASRSPMVGQAAFDVFCIDNEFGAVREWVIF
jgi:hypothetical protein